MEPTKTTFHMAVWMWALIAIAVLGAIYAVSKTPQAKAAISKIRNKLDESKAQVEVEA